MAVSLRDHNHEVINSVKSGRIQCQSTNVLLGFPDEFINNSPDDDNSIKGLKNFTIIKIIISKIEWLFLASQGHRRAKFEIDREGSLTKIIRKFQSRSFGLSINIIELIVLV